MHISISYTEPVEKSRCQIGEAQVESLRVDGDYAGSAENRIWASLQISRDSTFFSTRLARPSAAHSRLFVFSLIPFVVDLLTLLSALLCLVQCNYFTIILCGCTRRRCDFPWPCDITSCHSHSRVYTFDYCFLRFE